MAKNKLKKRVRKAAAQGAAAARGGPAASAGPGRSAGPNEPWVPEREFTWPDQDRGDDPDGGAGVREPRQPRPTMPAAAITLAEPELQYLDLTR